jgi:hypothetical protein
MIITRQGIGAEGFTQEFKSVTQDAGGLLDLEGFRSILQRSKGLPTQIREAVEGIFFWRNSYTAFDVPCIGGRRNGGRVPGGAEKGKQ